MDPSPPPAPADPARDPHDPREQRARLGAAVRALRRSEGLTLRELATRVGVAYGVLMSAEEGRTDLDERQLRAVARALGTWPVDLLVAQPVDGVRGAGATAGSPGHWRTFPPLALDESLTGALATFLALGYHGDPTSQALAGQPSSATAPPEREIARQQLLTTLHVVLMDELRARTSAAIAEGGDPLARFCNAVECLTLFHAHRRDLSLVGIEGTRVIAASPAHDMVAVRVAQQRMIDATVLDGAAAGLFATATPREASRAIVAMCVGVARWFRADGPDTAEQVATQHVRFALAVVGHHAAAGTEQVAATGAPGPTPAR